MNRMFSLRVYRLNDYYLEDWLHQQVQAWYRLLWLEDGSGMLFQHMGNTSPVPQFPLDGTVVLFSKLFYETFLNHYPHYHSCLLFDLSGRQECIALELRQSCWLTVVAGHLEESIVQGQPHECLQSFIDLLLLIAGNGYNAANGITVNSFQAERYREAKLLLHMNYKQERNVAFYAERMNMSSRALNLICKRVSGISLTRELLEHRNAEAQRLLLYTAKSVKEIGLELGYLNQAHFAGFFKKYNKMSPGIYRKTRLLPGKVNQRLNHKSIKVE